LPKWLGFCFETAMASPTRHSSRTPLSFSAAGLSAYTFRRPPALAGHQERLWAPEDTAVPQRTSDSLPRAAAERSVNRPSPVPNHSFRVSMGSTRYLRSPCWLTGGTEGRRGRLSAIMSVLVAVWLNLAPQTAAGGTDISSRGRQRLLSGTGALCLSGQVNATNTSVPSGWQCTRCLDGFACPQNGTMTPCMQPDQFASHGAQSTWGGCSNVSIGFYTVRSLVNGTSVGISAR
jgi:hypothetical protein